MTYAVSFGVLLEGLALNSSTGVISGTPTQASSGLRIDVTGTSGSETATAAITFNIASASITPSVEMLSATANTLITPVTFTADGFGSETITYTALSGPLPDGLSLNAVTGDISGTPTVAGFYGIFMQATAGSTFAYADIFITITAGVATQLAITAQPSASAASGVVFAQQPVIQLRDASGNAVSQVGVVVTVAIASGGGTLGGTTTATTNDTGVGTLSGLSVTGAAGVRTLRFTATDLTGVTSGNLTVTAGVATQLAITTPSSASTASGVVFAQQPAIQLRDVSGNAVSQVGVVVTVAIASGGGTLGGTTTATTNDTGVGTFTGLSVTGAAGVRTLRFTATDLTGVTSVNLTVTAAPAPGPAPGPAPAPAPATPTTPVTPAPSPTSPVTPVVPVALSPAQFMLGLTPMQVQALTGDELAALPPAAFAVMSPAQGKALNPDEVSGLSAAQIRAIPAESLRAMKPATLNQLSVTQIRALTNAQALDLRAKQIKALGPVKRKIVKSKR